MSGYKVTYRILGQAMLGHESKKYCSSNLVCSFCVYYTRLINNINVLLIHVENITYAAKEERLSHTRLLLPKCVTECANACVTCNALHDQVVLATNCFFYNTGSIIRKIYYSYITK